MDLRLRPELPAPAATKKNAAGRNFQRPLYPDLAAVLAPGQPTQTGRIFGDASPQHRITARAGAAVTHVVFDMDDVLAVRDTAATCASLALAAGLAPDEVMERLYLPEHTSFDEGADAGKDMATGDEFVRQLNDQLRGGRAVTREDWVAARRAGMDPAPLAGTVALARAVRDGGRATLVLLTNNNPLLAEELPAIFPEVAQLFAPHAWCSSMFGTAKPDPMVFERLALTLGVPPASLYFVDDNASNIAAAKQAGLRGAFHFTGPNDVPALWAALVDAGALPT